MHKIKYTPNKRKAFEFSNCHARLFWVTYIIVLDRIIIFKTHLENSAKKIETVLMYFYVILSGICCAVVAYDRDPGFSCIWVEKDTVVMHFYVSLSGIFCAVVAYDWDGAPEEKDHWYTGQCHHHSQDTESTHKNTRDSTKATTKGMCFRKYYHSQSLCTNTGTAPDDHLRSVS